MSKSKRSIPCGNTSTTECAKVRADSYLDVKRACIQFFISRNPEYQVRRFGYKEVSAR